MKKITFLAFLICITISWAQPGPNDGTSFNGVDEFILMPDSDNINTTSVNNRTVETYFKVTDATNRQVFYKEGAQVNTIKFYVENGMLHVGSYRNNGGNGNSIWWRTPINNDTWYHVAIVLDNASVLRFFLDGVLQDENTDYFQLPPHSGNFELGRTQGPARYPNCSTWSATGTAGVDTCEDDVTGVDSTVLFFGGRMWGFRIWDVVRTAQEINDNKDILITDTSTAPGNQLIAFLNGSTMTFKDSNDNFDQKEKEGEALSLENVKQNKLKVRVNENNIEVFTNNSSQPESLVLFDLLGKKVGQVSNSSVISTVNLSTGIYIFRIFNEGKVVNKKLLLQNN